MNLCIVSEKVRGKWFSLLFFPSKFLLIKVWNEGLLRIFRHPQIPYLIFRRTFFHSPFDARIQKSSRTIVLQGTQANREPKSSAWGTNEVDHSPFWMDPVVTIALPLSPALFSVQSSTFFFCYPGKKSIDDDAGGLFWFSIFNRILHLICLMMRSFTSSENIIKAASGNDSKCL